MDLNTVISLRGQYKNVFNFTHLAHINRYSWVGTSEEIIDALSEGKNHTVTKIPGDLTNGITITRIGYMEPHFIQVPGGKFMNIFR